MNGCITADKNKKIMVVVLTGLDLQSEGKIIVMVACIFFGVMGRAEGKEEGKGEAKSKRGLLKKGRRAFLLFVKSTSLTLGLSF